MKYSLIASSSQGNCLLVIEKDTAILVDMGISLARVEQELFQNQLTFKRLDAILYTHDHSDHYIDYKQIDYSKVYALKDALPDDHKYNEVELYKEFKIKDLTITPIATSHDTVIACGYFIKGEGSSLLYMTDTGKFINDNLKYVKNPTYLLIESNHDISMLVKSNRSYALKSRIQSSTGHLSNEDSASATTSIIGPNTKEIVLCHMSQECNSPEKALEAYRKCFLMAHINIDKYIIKCGKPDEVVRGGEQ
ncbi:MAG: MBL fold metallo-hydrolase [Coprobacillus sp.]|nr:MBL fold metallo-hydrolase [Coprobacillus sp.]